ncbi:mitogen-activated protein kinase kinase kinase 18-like [Chenopodium quinoa]|uniref:mitogen-activated protein kinase kinase kinase 18-like n=1 Tax=Chenopodium quinoa TaxID=63459 RepID=UPI000B77529C|nr:mitogen-activated protein kinase kinase kinase 18-like [Chenopodium quinoa]
MEVENSKWVRGKMIGKGSYGSVSVGLRESDGSRFAVKSASKQSLQSLECLENEIKILRSLSLSSPFIVEYYGDDETTSHRNLHLEYLPEGDVARIGGVDVELIRSYAWCLVKALKEVHSKGVVHCDIKGSNVLVGSTHGVVKLADFGSSKFVSDQDQSCKIVPRGSPLWMAPEAVRGEAQGFESDIWSIGCTVIEMFTGVPAWQDNGARTLFKIGYSNELPEYPKNISELGRDFLDKCLNRNPEQRWSCDQLLQHPFLVPVTVSKVTESTPRSILDWNNLDFSDDDEVSTPSSSTPSSPLSSWCDGLFEGVSSARDRVGKLASTMRVNWESEGWEEVRCLRSKKEEEVSEGTSSEYSDFEGANWTIPTWVNLSSSSSNDDNDEKISSVSGADGGGGRCGHSDSCGGGDMIENNNIHERQNMDYTTHKLIWAFFQWTARKQCFLAVGSLAEGRQNL